MGSMRKRIATRRDGMRLKAIGRCVRHANEQLAGLPGLNAWPGSSGTTIRLLAFV